MEASDKAVKLPKFDGKRESFTFWWMKFTAYARVYNFMEALKKDASLPGREDEVLATGAEGKLQAQAKQRNNIAMIGLVSAFSKEADMSIVDASITDEYPYGLAYIVVEELQKKYLPLDAMTRIELQTELNNICMKRKENPLALFEQIASIRNRYNQRTYKVSKDDLFAVVMAAAPMEYQAALVAEQRHQGNNLTLDLRNATA